MITLTHVSKEFKLTKKSRNEMGDAFRNAKTITAVDDVGFQCPPGSVFGLLGPNGAGKTTTLRMVATMLKPTSGIITVSGFDTQTHPQKVREKIGFMTGQTALYDRLTPNEMVQYIADLQGMGVNEFKSRRDQLFDVLDMHDFANRRIARLSTGMKQKTSIARTIIHNPDVVIFDEPTAGLDVMTSRRIIELIRTCREEGKTILFSTHRMEEIKLLCDDIAIIHQGRLFFSGTLETFESQMTYDNFEDEFIHMTEEAS